MKPSLPDTSWPVTATVLHDELKAMQGIAGRWASRFGSEEFLAEFDALSDEERAAYFVQLVNEMKVVAAKSATLVEVLG